MSNISANAYEAHIAGAILALGIQNINRLNQEEIDRVYEYALDIVFIEQVLTLNFQKLKK